MPTPSCPPSPDAGGHGRVVGYLAELLHLTPAQLQYVTIDLRARLSTTAAVSDSFKAPNDVALLIFSLQGYVLFPTLNTEPTAILGWLNLPPSERLLVKAQNCLVKLENTDRSLKVTDARDIALSAITPPVGSPLTMPLEAPLIVPQSQSLKATFTLQDATAAIVGNASDYGVLMSGVYVPSDLLRQLNR